MGGFFNSWSTAVVNILSALGSPIPGPWRPPQYQRPQVVSLTVTLPSQTTNTVSSKVLDPSTGAVLFTGSTTRDNPGTPTTYFFDAVIRVHHNEEVVTTKHPVQDGASITDHAYALPAMVTLEVGFSDAQQSYVMNQYSGGKSKSVQAYQALKKVKDLRLPCTLSTRLNQYTNMIIKQMSPDESLATTSSLRMTIRLEQIILGTLSTQTVSARTDQTNSTNEGTKNPQSPSSTLGQTLQNPDGTWNSNTKP